ncbi:MAG TPA: TIGR01777 family oxidoreductase, partial [Acidimicrobiales bacterium]|nr:TIGR01777 family oxidoreductase [Acidimicrobiales bacterium]
LDGADAVVHLAGAGIGDKRWSATRRQEIVSSRVQSTALLARSLAELDRPPSVLVSASAVGVYGDRGDEELTEASGPGSGFLAELCRAWEDATGRATQAGIRVVRLRSGVVLSAHGGALARQLPLFRLGVGGRLGSGRQWLSWISLADEVGAVLHALDEPSLEGPVNATAPTPVTNRDFTAALGRALHRPAVLAVPGFALRVALGSDLASEMVLAGQRVLPAKLSASGYEFSHADIDTALAALLASGA